MGIHHSPHTHPTPIPMGIPMGIPIPTAALQQWPLQVSHGHRQCRHSTDRIYYFLYWHSTVTMALYCIVSEIKRDIGRKSHFFPPLRAKEFQGTQNMLLLLLLLLLKK